MGIRQAMPMSSKPRARKKEVWLKLAAIAYTKRNGIRKEYTVYRSMLIGRDSREHN